ncbi:hypothetical protein T492DRAFT_413067 [Pavlovales sp. CCMP2436]|nr:hypothetical protein T492DRAFT_413067 [Pavlovales sp. CCMP2436]
MRLEAMGELLEAQEAHLYEGDADGLDARADGADAPPALSLLRLWRSRLFGSLVTAKSAELRARHERAKLRELLRAREAEAKGAREGMGAAERLASRAQHEAALERTALRLAHAELGRARRALGSQQGSAEAAVALRALVRQLTGGVCVGGGGVNV